jgi:hypothetical protein
MGNHQRSNSRTVLDQLFWAGTASPSQSGRAAPQVGLGAAAERREPKADTSEPGLAQEIPSVGSPAIQPILIESVADQQFRIELQEGLTDAVLNDKRRGEIAELMDTLRGNLDKIEQHGKRADALVKNMLLHSREGSGEHLAVDISAAVK